MLRRGTIPVIKKGGQSMGPQGPQEPQVVQQPEQPIVPSSGSVPPIASQPMPGAKKGLSKGALWGIIGGAAGVVLLLVGVILAVTVFGGPNKADYEKAASVFSEATTAYNDMGIKSYELTSSSSTETTRKNALEGMKKLQETFNTKFEEAGKLKGIANDKALKDKWTKVDEKRAKFNSSVEEIYEISEKVTPIVKELSDFSSPTVSEVSSLRKKIEGVSVKNAATNTYITALANFLKAYEDYATYRASGSYDSSAYSKYNAAYNAYYDASKDWRSSIEKMTDEAELKNELNALSDALNEKEFAK